MPNKDYLGKKCEAIITITFLNHYSQNNKYNGNTLQCPSVYISLLQREL